MKKQQKYGIKNIISMKFTDLEGNELIDIRDKEPEIREFNPDTPILDLLKDSSPSYQLSTHPLMKKYGYDTFGSASEKWYWRDNLEEATEIELWQMFGMIQADWYADYSYYYYKEVYEFRKYKREVENIK